MFFHALTFAVARGSCLNPWPSGQGFKLLRRDTANVNALKLTCVIVIFAFLNDSIENITENNI